MKFKKILSLFLSVLMIVTVISASPVTSLASYEDNILFEEDFDDYEIRTYTKTELAEIKSNTSFGSSWNKNYEVKKKKDKNYLSIAAPNRDIGNGYIAVLDEPVTHGNFVAEMKVLPQEHPSGTHYWNYLVVRGVIHGTTTKQNYLGLSTSNGENLVTTPNNNSVFGNAVDAVDNMPVPDADGFWNLRLVVSRETTDDNWSMTYYDATNNKVIKSKPSVTLNKINITGVSFVDMWGTVSNPSGQNANVTDLKLYIPADVDVTQIADYDANEKKVIFSASERLLDETVSNDTITILSPSGEEVIGDVSLDENGQDIVVSFPYGLPENGSYEITSDGVQTERNIPVSFSESFEGTKAIIPFAVAEVSPDEGVISALQKSITLSFTKEPDDKLINEITFKKANGDDIPGLYETEVNGKNVIVSFGKLNPGDYVLTVGSAFADREDGTQLGEACVFNYTVEEAKSDGEDYQGEIFVSGNTYTAQQIQGMSENITYGASGIYSIDEVDGDKFVSLKAPSANAGASVAYVLPDAVTDGVAEMDLKIKGSGDNLARHVMRVYGSSGNVYLLSMNNGSNITLSTASNNAGGAFSDDAPEAGADGFFSLKLRMTANNSSDDWLIEIFDTSDSKRLFYSTTVPRSKLSDITKISAGEIWTVSSAETARSLSVSEMWFRHSEFVSVIEAQTEVLPTDETLVFKLDDDITADEMSAKLISADNTEINCESTYSAVERKLYVKPQSFLEWGMTYTFNTTGAGIKPYTFTVLGGDCEVNQKKVSYSTESVTVYDMPIAGTFDASVYVSVNAPKGREIMIIFAGYDAKGYPVKISHKNVVSSGGSADDTVTLEGLTAEECKTVQCFIWEKTTFGYKVIK